MAKFVKCDCGVTVRNDDIDALVAEVQQHVVEAHWTEVEREDVLEMVEPATFEAGARPPMVHVDGQISASGTKSRPRISRTGVNARTSSPCWL